MADLIDPTATEKYPVILADGLLPDSDSSTIFTGIKYNHKPVLSSDSASNNARLKPSLPGSTTSFDLSYNDDKNGKYAYAGTRAADGSQYVLYFDPARKAFVLDRIETTFNMNITRLPNNSDPDSLSRKYPHLEGQKKSKPEPKPTSSKEKPKPAAKARAKSPLRSKDPKRKPEKEKKNEHVPLTLPPKPAKPEPKPKPKPRSRGFDEEEEEDDDDDGGLLVEYPGAESAPMRRTDFSPAFPSVRRFDEFMDQRESEGDDADGESDGEVDIDFKLPSPMNLPAVPQFQANIQPDPMDQDDAGDDADDLEKDLENAFEDLANSPQAHDDESEISEED